MAWIESHQELRDHPKTKRAARTLGISVVQLVGHLHFVWWRALEYAQDGDLAGYEAADIADWAGWEGDPEQFMEALALCGVNRKAGFIEWREETESFWLHDWYEYAGKLLRRRVDNAQRMRNARASETELPSEQRAGHVQDTCDARAVATVPNRTVPNQPTVPTDSPVAVAPERPETPSEPQASQEPEPEPPTEATEPRKPRGSPKASRIAALVDAFREAGLPDPHLPAPQAKAAGALLADFSPDEVAECVRDVGGGDWGDSWLRENLSFTALLSNSRIANWRRWRDAGRPPTTNGKELNNDRHQQRSAQGGHI